MHRSYNPYHPSASKLLQKRWDDQAYKTHREQLKHAHGTTDNSTPVTFLHVHLKLKKIQQQEERNAVIERDNKIMLEKMAKIDRHGGDIDQYNEEHAVYRRSLHASFRKKEQMRIAKDNLRMARRIVDAKPIILTARLEKDWQTNVRYLDNISAYPKDWNAKQSSSPPDQEDDSSVETNNDPVEYEIEIKTAKDLGSGTDSKVKIHLQGAKGKPVEVELTKNDSTTENKSLFETDQVDKFKITAPDIGKLKKVTVYTESKDFGSDWKVEYVKVVRADDSYSFEVNQWINKKQPKIELQTKNNSKKPTKAATKNTKAQTDSKTNKDAKSDSSDQKSVKYQIDIKTAKDSPGADLLVKLRLIGANEKSVDIELDKKDSTTKNKDIFAPGQLDQFNVTNGTDVGKLNKLIVSAEFRGKVTDWKLENIKITAQNNSFNFTVNKMLNKKEARVELIPDGTKR